MSGSLRLIHPLPLHLILHSALNPIHLLSVSAAKSVLLLLHNTALCQDWKVLSTIQIHSTAQTVHLQFSYMDAVFRPCAIHACFWFGIFVDGTLCSLTKVRAPIVDCATFFVLVYIFILQEYRYSVSFVFVCMLLLLFCFFSVDIPTETWPVCIHLSPFFPPYPSVAPCSFILSFFQVMETKNMLYLVTEYAKNGEIFGKYPLFSTRFIFF